jgi:UDP-N-acetylglucosamine--N-acetylmuramyl-(pentapeptide) pyrophosphoryl-undecaprenol N-acetylglucosamine transferase
MDEIGEMIDMRVLIAGGGTGGHLYPGIAIAEEVTRRPGGQVLFVGTARGLETKLVPAAGFELELLQVSGLNRVGLTRFLRGLVRLPRAFFASRGVLKRFGPDLVIGVGGYASGPLVLTAALLGYPTAIQEQNSRPGFTNRVLGRFVRRVFVAFEDARAFFARRKTLLVGNPVRRRFLDSSRVSARPSTRIDQPPGDRSDPSDPSDPSDRSDDPGDRSDDPGDTAVLIVGGSQGARAVNDLVIGAVAILHKDGRMPRIVHQVLHQTGAADEARVRERYAALGLADAVEVRPFIDDMPAALARAALVVGRAGALTLAELAMVGRPAILIPLPTAAADHQTRNAAEFARAGAAIVADQKTTTPDALARLIADLCADPPRRAEMSRAMAQRGRPDAAREIVDELERIAAVPASRAGAPP